MEKDNDVASDFEKRFYLLIADEETWKIAFDKKIFAFSDKAKGSWNKSEVNELVAFYATSPIKKIIGFGRIKEKFIDEKIIFPDEILFKRSIYKFKIKLELFFILKSFDEGIKAPPTLMLNVARKVVPKEIFFSFVKKADQAWKTGINKKIKLSNK